MTADDIQRMEDFLKAPEWRGYITTFNGVAWDNLTVAGKLMAITWLLPPVPKKPRAITRRAFRRDS